MRAIGVELQDVLRAGAPPRVASMLRGEPVTIDSDGSTMRDSSHLANVVRATPLATTVARVSASKQVCSVAVGGPMSLPVLFGILRKLDEDRHPKLRVPDPLHADFRVGNARHSQADVSKAARSIRYAPSHDARAGRREAFAAYEEQAGGRKGGRTPVSRTRV